MTSLLFNKALAAAPVQAKMQRTMSAIGCSRPMLPRCVPKQMLQHVSRAGQQQVLRAVSVGFETEQLTTQIEPVTVNSLSLLPSGQSGQGTAFGAALRGRPEPLGATIDQETEGVNFAVFSSNATGISLVLFTEEDLEAGRTTYEVPFDPVKNKSGDVWHILLPGLNTSLLYGFRVLGEHQDQLEEAAGQRFREDHVVLDPYAQGIISRRDYGKLAKELPYGTEDVLGLAQTWPQHAGVLPQRDNDFDWEGDRPLNVPMEDLIIYEMHVRGFTQDPSSKVVAPGTYAGMIEKLDYLKDLGVNAIELLPIFEFNELEYYTPIPGSVPTQYRHNFWGYSTIGFFSPMSRYSFSIQQGAPGDAMVKELKTLVRECHKRGIEVILDVVFNHTAEGNELGPTLSFRGLDNRTYYMLAPQGQYYNYSGCGNTLNCNQPQVRRFILDCLRFWVEEYHIDGFRFDLASILTRAQSAWHQQEITADGQRSALFSGGGIIDVNGLMTDGAGVPTGTPLSDPPVVELISADPVLQNTKLIAEAWDADGLNQVGAFPHYGGRWAEWNGHFRDTIRQFIKGTDNWAGAFASAICGSPNIYASQPGEADWWGNNGGRKWRATRQPYHSINFVTAHDGFTLNDLVSFNNKHNEANGENNNDGEAHNLSWNCGEEGVSPSITVNRLRQRQMRNMVTALLVSQGVPMLQMSDEYGHTKSGNNNTYCHDSPLNWMDWTQAEADETGFRRFVRSLIKLRHAHPELRRQFYVTANDVQWHGEEPHKPDWSDASRLVAFTINNGKGDGLYVAFNTSHTPRVLTLPRWPDRIWQPVVDSSRVAPFDVLIADDVLSEEDVIAAKASLAMWSGEHMYHMLPWSCVVLESAPPSSAAFLKYKGAGRKRSVPTQRGPPQDLDSLFPAGRASPPPPSPTTPRPTAGRAPPRPPTARSSNPQNPSTARTPGPQNPATAARTPGPQTPSTARTPGPQNPSTARTPGPQNPSTARTPGPQNPSTARTPGPQNPSTTRTPGPRTPTGRPAPGRNGTRANGTVAAPANANATQPAPRAPAPSLPQLTPQEIAALEEARKENERLRRKLGIPPRS